MGLQLASWVIPLTTILPPSVLRQVIWRLGFFDEIINKDIRETYDAPLSDYIFNYLTTSNHSVNDLIFTGHSLGGAISQVVAAQLHGLQKRVCIRSFI